MLVIMVILIGSLYLVSTGQMTGDQVLVLWGGILSGMGIGFINGRKSGESS